MTTAQVKARIEAETGMKITVKKGKNSMTGYTYFSVRKTQKFDFSWRTEFVSQFPACDVRPAFSSDLSIMIYHGIEG